MAKAIISLVIGFSFFATKEIIFFCGRNFARMCTKFKLVTYSSANLEKVFTKNKEN